MTGILAFLEAVMEWAFYALSRSLSTGSEIHRPLKGMRCATHNTYSEIQTGYGSEMYFAIAPGRFLAVYFPCKY